MTIFSGKCAFDFRLTRFMPKISTFIPFFPPFWIAAAASAWAFRSSIFVWPSGSICRSRPSLLPATSMCAMSIPTTSETINIETTARGIDMPSEVYLGIDTRKLPKRTLREVIGLAFMNQASVGWHRKDFATTIKLYEQASHFLPDDYLLNMFLGYNYLFANRIKEGKALLKKIQGQRPDHMISGDSVSEDYLAGKTDPDAILAIYTEIDEKRSSILEKQKKLEEVVRKFPAFRQGILHLAITHLQLGREKEALPLLERYIALDPNDPTATIISQPSITSASIS